MEKIIVLLLIMLGILSDPKLSAQTSVSLSSEEKIALGLDSFSLVEPHLTVNEKNPAHLLIGAIIVNPKKTNDYGCVAVVSKNNGKSWKYFRFPIAEGADPWCEILDDGTAIFSVLGLDSLYIYRSPDGGETWSTDYVVLGTGYDHEVITNDKKNGALYVTAIANNNISIDKSVDRGKSFPLKNVFKFSNLNSNAANSVVSENGTLIIPFTTFQRNGIPKNEWLSHSLSWMVTTKDGNSFTTPSFICESCGKGFPTMAIDSSSKYRDRLYWVCSSEENKAIYFHYSNNLGKNWSSPKLIAYYTNAAPLARETFTAIPTVAVNTAGVVGIVWQTRIDDKTNQCQWLEFTASPDGGESFFPVMHISTVPSCPENTENGWAGRRWKAGGDYIGLTSLPGGKFRTVWADSRNGYFQLYTREISVDNSQGK